MSGEALIDRPADELTPDELEQALTELPTPPVCVKCATELRKSKRWTLSNGGWEHVEQIRGHKAVPR